MTTRDIARTPRSFGPPPTLLNEYEERQIKLARAEALRRMRARADRARARARTGLASLPRLQVKNPPSLWRRLLGRIRKWISALPT